MTDISESGLTAASETFFAESFKKTPTEAMRAAIQAYLPFHPPASREEGLSSVLDAYDAETAKVPLGHENRSRGASTYNWRRAIVAELRELIPTKPEAKPSWSDVDYLMSIIDAAIEDGFDPDEDAQLLDEIRAEGKARAQSKKPE